MAESMTPLVGPEPPKISAAGRIRSTLSRRPFVERSVAFYHRHEHLAPALFFFCGVAWDVATLRRIDSVLDDVYLLVYNVLLGVVILVATLVAYGKTEHRWLLKYRDWYPHAIQFVMGALFSAYVVFYSQSASLTETSVFLVLLVMLMVVNEFIHRRLLNLYLLLGLYFLTSASFFIFFIPVVTRVMGFATFFAGGLMSVLVVAGMLRFLHRRGVFEKKSQLVIAGAVVVGLFGLLNLFYVQNWIPPVPLALRHGGMYHQVQVGTGGNVYELSFERPPWYRFWIESDHTFARREGEPVYCFTAIFAPAKFQTRVYHEWLYFDEGRSAWVQTDRIGYRIVGKRDRGYRGFTRKRNLRPGRWRVDVQTEDGRTLGRIRFNVSNSDGQDAPLTTLFYD